MNKRARHCFATADVLRQAEELLGSTDRGSLLACEMARKEVLGCRRRGDVEREAFFQLVGEYCFYTELASASAARRFAQMLTASDTCCYPYEVGFVDPE